jgi:hypothetical protein
MARFSYHPCLPFAIACGLFFAVGAGSAAGDDAAGRREHGDQVHGLYPDKDHAVVKGDTLWDLSAAYLKDPFIWPDIWQVNPQISHPDLIYPGNHVNLPGYRTAPIATMAPRPGGPAAPMPVATAASAAAPGAPPTAEPAAKVVVPAEVVGRTGWIVGEGEKVGLGTILGNWHSNRYLLGTDAAVHVSLGARDGVVAGDRFRIVNSDRIVYHPRTRQVVGRMVKVVGEVEIVDVRDATATGRVTRANEAIQVGDAILAAQEILPVTEPTQAEARDLRATVLASFDDRFALAESDVIFLDVGQSQSVQPGDRFWIQGDMAGAMDGLPRYAAEAVVIAAQDSTCTAVITQSLTETFVGDRATYTTAALPDIYHQ